VYGVRNITPIMLGINRVSHLKFLALNVIGAGVWAAAFTWGGFFFGKLFATFMHEASHMALYGLAAAAVIAGLVWYVRQRRRSRDLMRIVENNTATTKQDPHNNDMA
jgi:membrane protein DedA with SNARE-associated domain